jgi:phosphomevalonate kinase
MKARAPGKLVLSGAYSVLEGAPAIVTAVDRYASADTSAAATRVTPEVAAALGARANEAAPAFDADELRQGEHKLGLGSSAAILLASLAALELAESPGLGDQELAERLFPRALEAHHQAQGGGSGVDVAASAYGGTLRFVRSDGLPQVQPLELPAELVVEAWWSGQPASTSELLAKVAHLKQLLPDVHRGLIEAQAAAAEQAAVALQLANLTDFFTAIHLQLSVLSALGTLSRASIVTREAERLAKQAAAEGGAALPAGAGGGDVLLFYGTKPSTRRFRRMAVECRHHLLELRVGARGVHGVG